MLSPSAQKEVVGIPKALLTLPLVSTSNPIFQILPSAKPLTDGCAAPLLHLSASTGQTNWKPFRHAWPGFFVGRDAAGGEQAPEA